MKRELFHNVERYIEERRRRKRWHSVLGVLACVTVICTAYMLLQSGRAMEPEHVHSQDCYTQVISIPRLQLACSAESLKIHKHISPCYDSEGNLVCGYADYVVHKHDSKCYDENGGLLCTLPEIEAHTHTAECYAQTSQADLPPAEGEDAGPELICGKEEIVLHEHTDECYDKEHNLICGKIQVLEHQHTDECFQTEEVPVDTESLTCTLPEDENHTHDRLCYGTWELTCGMKEHRAEEDNQEQQDSAESDLPSDAGNTIYTSDDIYNEESSETTGEESSNVAGEISSGIAGDAADDESANETAESPKDRFAMSRPEVQTDTDGTLKVSLSYGDNKEYPEGYFSFTHSTMSGFINLEPSGLTADLENAIVRLKIPKQYVEKDTISIPQFNTSSSVTEYEISKVTEDNDNYYISITFIKYDKTQTLNLPFALSFKDDVVPDNYQLPVTAGVYQNDSTLSHSNEIIYKPKYKDWGIDKFVNSNKNNIYKADGAESVVTTKDETGNPYVDDKTYVHFAFIVNNVINQTSNLADFRDACEVTLRDTLPTYEKTDGTFGTAVFDSDKNPGWTLSEDGLTVSKTYTGENSHDVLNQIYNDELLLKFPNLKLEPDKNEPNDLDRVIASLNNHVSLQAVPSNAAKGETNPTAKDSLKFCITDKLGSTGKFTKTAEKGNIYDAMMYKTNPYPWKIRLENNHVEPLEHIKIEDREIIGEDGKIAVEGLDKALKFVKIDSDYTYSTLPAGKTYADIIDKIVAYYEDGLQQDYYISQSDLDKSKNFTVEFDESRVCNGYEIIFKDDYKMEMNGKLTFRAYTVYRDPEHTRIPAGTKQLTYYNQARAVSDCMGVIDYLWAKYEYDMLPVSEKLEIGKETWYNKSNQNNMVGNVYQYFIYLKGSLATPDQKKYGDIRIVDLLPEEVEYVRMTNGYNEYTDKYGKPGMVDIEENYHNSGRTAVIAHITYENLIKYWYGDGTPNGYKNSNGTLSFEVRIREDAHSGTVTNYAYVVGDNLEEYTEKTGGTEDIYDLNNNGRTDDRIAYAQSDAVIMAAQSIYAEKFIAPAGSEAWNKQGLSLKAGSEFDYLLKVTNETTDEKTGLVVYDTLPQIGDKNIFSSSGRGSEFPVRLRGAITPPEGYTVYYTTSPDVYSCTMSDMVAREEIWSTAVAGDWSNITAFKLVADEGISLTKEDAFQVRVPVCVPSEFEQSAIKLLDEKPYQDQGSGTSAYLQAKNSFGFYTKEAPEPKESNTVWVRVPFAGFIVKKVDSVSKLEIEGAAFTLKKDEDPTFSQKAASNEKGLLEFRNLTEGTYTLTETEFPAGYTDQRISLKVVITQNPTTMEYTVTFEDSFTGAGSSSDPLLIENELSTYELPATGGSGTALYAAAGFLMVAAVLLLLYVRKKRERE